MQKIFRRQVTCQRSPNWEVSVLGVESGSLWHQNLSLFYSMDYYVLGLWAHSQPSESTLPGYFNSRYSLMLSSGNCIVTSLQISTPNYWNWIYAMDPKKAVSCLQWLRNNTDPANARIWLAKRSHQIGRRSIRSATPGLLENMGIGGEIHLSPQSYNWKLYLQQGHSCLWGKVPIVVLGIHIRFGICCLRVNTAGLIQFLILQKTFEEDCTHFTGSSHQILVSPPIHSTISSAPASFNLSCGEWGAQLRAEFGKTFWIL